MGGITDDGLRLDGGPRLGQGNRTSANSSCSKCKNVFDPLNLPGMSGALPPPPPRDTTGFERKLRSQSMETLLQSFDNKSSLDHHDSFHTHSYSTEMSEPGFWKRQRLPSLDSTMSGPSAPEKKARLRTASLDRFFHNMAPDASEDSIPLDLPNIPPANSSHQPSLFANPDATPFGSDASLSETSGPDLIRTRPDSTKLFSFGGVSPDSSQQMMVKEEGTLSDFNRRNFNSSSMTTPPSPFLENDDDLLTDMRLTDTCDSKIYISAIDPGKALKLEPGIELSTHGGMLGPDIWA